MHNPHIEIINSLASDVLEVAQAKALKILDEYKFRNGSKKIRLIEDIKKSRKAVEVCRIMYYTVLAGEGLSVINGNWQKEYAR